MADCVTEQFVGVLEHTHKHVMANVSASHPRTALALSSQLIDIAAHLSLDSPTARCQAPLRPCSLPLLGAPVHAHCVLHQVPFEGPGLCPRWRPRVGLTLRLVTDKAAIVSLLRSLRRRSRA